MIYQHFSIISIILVAVVAVISLTLHEYAHGLVAMWNGDYTAKYNGRLTLNPLAHFDIFGFIMLMTVGFGYAKPVPVNPFNFKHQKLGIFTVAIAGVTVNLLLAFISCGLMFLMMFLQSKFGGAAKALQIFEVFFYYMVTINISFMLFNLIPIHPLDGFRVVEAFTRYSNPITKFFRDFGQYILLLLVGMGIIVDVFNLASIFPPLMWLDPLGMYIRTVGGWIQNLFSMFWNLIF